jgi:hypothetical protein
VQFKEAGLKDNAPGPLDALIGAFIPGDAEGVILQLDASINENHSFSSNITEHPIENNSVISDHVILRPRLLHIEGTVTDTPVQFLSVLTTGSLGNVGGQSLSPSLQSWQTLLHLWIDRIPFDVVTGKDFYKNMIIRTVNSQANAMIGRQNKFSIELQQLQIVETDVDFNENSILATDAELGYLSNQIPSATAILQATAFLTLIGLDLI